MWNPFKILIKKYIVEIVQEEIRDVIKQQLNKSMHKTELQAYVKSKKTSDEFETFLKKASIEGNKITIDVTLITEDDDKFRETIEFMSIGDLYQNIGKILNGYVVSDLYIAFTECTLRVRYNVRNNYQSKSFRLTEGFLEPYDIITLNDVASDLIRNLEMYEEYLI